MTKAVKKKKAKKKTSRSSDIDRLIDSNIQLQHKMTDVVLSVKDLNGNVSSLIDIFKSAGEHIKSGKYDDPMINRLNELLDQNKKLKEALMLLEKYVKSRDTPRPSPL